jgi:hypothetical protein
MADKGKETKEIKDIKESKEKKITYHDLEWSDYVLGLLSDDEKIEGNPTTDGLRRVFEIAMNCEIIDSLSEVVQSPSIDNEKRATVVHMLSYIVNGDKERNTKTVSGAADVYWGNCDKIFRNHPVAVAETRAEGRALRRGLRLRKVVTADELSREIEDNPDGDSVTKISNNQLNFMDVLAKRLDINMVKLLEKSGHKDKNIYNIEHSVAVDIIKNLSSYQQNTDTIPSESKGYDSHWK